MIHKQSFHQIGEAEGDEHDNLSAAKAIAIGVVVSLGFYAVVWGILGLV